MKKPKKVYAAYNGEPYKLYDVIPYNEDGTIDLNTPADAANNNTDDGTPQAAN